MLFSEIAKIIQGENLQASSDFEIRQLAYDSRKLAGAADTIFFALNGHNQNGHQFLQNAFDKGVRCFVISEKPEIGQLPDANLILVDDVLSALQKQARAYRESFNIPVVGITGSNGKTIVKEWLSGLLSEKYNVVKSPKSFNSQLGVPLSIWQIQPPHEIGVFEAGISQKGEMWNLAQIIQPTIGIFTNIGNAHDEGFESQKEKLKEKALLFANCGTIIYSQDQQHLSDFLISHFTQGLFSWSIEKKSADVFFERKNSSFDCHFKEQSFHFEIGFAKGFYLENLLHAITAALICGLSENQINEGIKKIRPVPMRLQLKRGVKDCYIVDDSYNNDLAGLSIALDYLKQQPQKKRKTVILSDIYQSGMEASELYAQVNDLLIKNDISQLIGIGSAIIANQKAFNIKTTFFESTKDFLNEMPAFENELILVKGARVFSFEKVVSLLEEKNHGTVLEVNFESLTHNLNTYRSKLNPDTKMMVMVKAFAYGGGMSEIGHLLQYQNVDYLGVAYIDEGVELRQKGIRLPIMVMNPDWDHFSIIESFDLEPEIYSLAMFRKFLEVAEKSAIHLKIETGMNRLGLREEDLDELIPLLIQNPQVRVAGIFTHFSSSEDAENDAFTIGQAEKFNTAYDKISKAIGYTPIKHALNSSGIVRWPQFHFDMVRLGIGLYGHDSSKSSLSLKPISTLKSRISQIRRIQKGESVGYSRKGMAQKESDIAVVSIGYADGYLRKFSQGKAYMLVNGQKAPTIGNVCMDMTMLDVTGLQVSEGDEVVVFGVDPNIEQLAEWGETIPYEILPNVSQRVKRVFVSE